MTLIEEIHCPLCGDKMFEVDMDDSSTIENAGKACPNKCGWITVEIQGESLAVLSSPCTY